MTNSAKIGELKATYVLQVNERNGWSLIAPNGQKMTGHKTLGDDDLEAMRIFLRENKSLMVKENGKTVYREVEEMEFQAMIHRFNKEVKREIEKIKPQTPCHKPPPRSKVKPYRMY